MENILTENDRNLLNEKIKNTKMLEEISLEEKINYIYEALKFQKRTYYIKLAIKLILVLILLYTVFIYIPSLPKKTVDALKAQTQEIISKNLKNIIGPLVKDISTDIMKNVDIKSIGNNINGNNPSSKIDYNQIEKISDMMKKKGLIKSEQ